MVGTQQDSPLLFWDKRIEYLIEKNKSIQKIRDKLTKERAKFINRKRKANRT